MRIDCNLPIKDSRFLSAYRLEAILSTINYLRAKGARIILMGHLDDPSRVMKRFSLRPISEILSKMIGANIVFLEKRVIKKTRVHIEAMQNGDIAMLENLRFDAREKENNNEFAKKISSCGDIYVNEAFSASHRAHASIVGIPRFVPSYFGERFLYEVGQLERVAKKDHKLFIVLLGGAKISTKLPLLKKFVSIADKILLGGAMVNAVLFRLGFNIGSSYLESFDVDVNFFKQHLYKKIIMPIDYRVVYRNRLSVFSAHELSNISGNFKIMDIGPDTCAAYQKIIESAHGAIWNGPMGYIEDNRFEAGTRCVAEGLMRTEVAGVIGGGETVDFMQRAYGDFFKNNQRLFLSTAGGAMLDFLSQGMLPGIEAIVNAKLKNQKSK